MGLNEVESSISLEVAEGGMVEEKRMPSRWYERTDLCTFMEHSRGRISEIMRVTSRIIALVQAESWPRHFGRGKRCLQERNGKNVMLRQKADQRCST